MNTHYWILTLLSITVFACGADRLNDDKLVAKVYDKELHYSQISYLFDGQSLPYEDSLRIAESYVNSWVEEQILVSNAEKSDKINLLEVENKANRYKNSLIIHKFENEYIEKNLDTNVSQNELTIYYKDHKNDFQLNDYLVKVLYLKIAMDAPEIEKIDKWYKLTNEKDIIQIENYAKLYASNFYYDDENWMYFDELTKEIPLKDINKDKFITRKSKIRLDEEGYYYFLNVIDYKLKNTTSPLDFEKENIKQRILNIRTKELREKLKQDNITKAYNEKSVKIY